MVELGPEGIEDVYRARVAIERETAMIAMAKDTHGIEEKLLQVLHCMATALDADQWQDVVMADLEFHQTIVDAAESPRLKRMFSTLVAETPLCLRRFQNVYERKETMLEQHRRLLELLQAGDEKAYLKEIDGHVKNSAVTLRSLPAS